MINDILNDKSYGISEDDWEMRTSGRVNAKLTGIPPRNQIQRIVMARQVLKGLPTSR